MPPWLAFFGAWNYFVSADGEFTQWSAHLSYALLALIHPRTSYQAVTRLCLRPGHIVSRSPWQARHRRNPCHSKSKRYSKNCLHYMRIGHWNELSKRLTRSSKRSQIMGVDDVILFVLLTYGLSYISRNNVHEGSGSYTYEPKRWRNWTSQERSRFRHAIAHLLACIGYNKEGWQKLGWGLKSIYPSCPMRQSEELLLD